MVTTKTFDCNLNLAVEEQILKRRKTEFTREHYFTMIFYNFKVGLDQEHWFNICTKHIKTKHHLVLPYSVGFVLLYIEFHRGWSSLLYEEYRGRPSICCNPRKDAGIRKLFIEVNRFTCQIIKKKLNTGWKAVYKIIHGEMHMKKLVCL